MDTTVNVRSKTADVNSNELAQRVSGRITSVDFFRGVTMFLLVGESTRLYYLLEDSAEQGGGPVVSYFARMFSHHEWHGLHFWDLIQPFFMFIVGVAIPFAVANRKKKGDADKTIFNHALKRSFLLLFFGWALYCMEAGEIVWRFQNVLAQLAVTYLVAFLIMRKSFAFQIAFTIVILLLTDLAYRFFPVEGFNHPWVPYENLGAWVNNKIEGVEKASIWASLNAIPTIAHTVWGVLCGLVLMSNRSSAEKMRVMVIAGGHWIGCRLRARLAEHHADHQEDRYIVVRIRQRWMVNTGAVFLLLADRCEKAVCRRFSIFHHCRHELHLHLPLHACRRRRYHS